MAVTSDQCRRSGSAQLKGHGLKLSWVKPMSRKEEVLFPLSGFVTRGNV